jgi:hypothetical protein
MGLWDDIITRIKGMASPSAPQAPKEDATPGFVSNPLMDEYLISKNLEGVTFPPLPGLPGTTWGAVRTPSAQPDPGIRKTVYGHENVHKGQFKANMANLPSYQDVDKQVFRTPGASQRLMDAYYNASIRPDAEPYELGAKLTEPKPMTMQNGVKWPTKNQIHGYMDLVYKRNPRQAVQIEARTPDPVIRGYVKSHPRPLVPAAHQKIVDETGYNYLR